MDTLGGQFIQQLVLIILALGFFLVFLFGILLQNLLSIGQRSFQFAGGIAGLGGVCLVHNNREPLIAGTHFFINNRELLEGGDDDACPGLDGLPKLLGISVALAISSLIYTGLFSIAIYPLFTFPILIT